MRNVVRVSTNAASWLALIKKPVRDVFLRTKNRAEASGGPVRLAADYLVKGAYRPPERSISTTIL